MGTKSDLELARNLGSSVKHIKKATAAFNASDILLYLAEESSLAGLASSSVVGGGGSHAASIAKEAISEECALLRDLVPLSVQADSHAFPPEVCVECVLAHSLLIQLPPNARPIGRPIRPCELT